ncbi:MAG: GNAT family N-acetyltransferase [Propionibacteriaceae bacterium]
MSTPPSVRLALPVEAKVIARMQRMAWQTDHCPEIAAAFLEQMDELSMIEAWHRAIVAPPLAQFRVLIATDDSHPVGFAAIGPADDPDAATADATIAEFVIASGHRRQGHGSRLMHAVTETLVADRFERARIWIPTTFDGLRTFLRSQNFAPDGAHQELVTENGAMLKTLRLHTSLV